MNIHSWGSKDPVTGAEARLAPQQALGVKRDAAQSHETLSFLHLLATFHSRIKIKQKQGLQYLSSLPTNVAEEQLQSMPLISPLLTEGTS